MRSEALQIAERFNYLTEGYRVLMLTQRKKEGGTKGNPDRHASKKVSRDFDSFVDVLTVMLERRTPDMRIYCSVNRRDVDKGIRNFKQLQLDNDYNPDYPNFYLDVHNRWISAIAKSSARAEGYFLFDLDDNDRHGVICADVHKKLKSLNDVQIIDKYRTKNGWHIITTPFQYPLVFPELHKWDHIKTDGMALLKY